MEAAFPGKESVMWDWPPFSWLRKRPALSRRPRSPRLRVEGLESRTVPSVVPGPVVLTQASLALMASPAPGMALPAFTPPVSRGAEAAFIPALVATPPQGNSPLWAMSPVDTLMAQGVNPALPAMSLSVRATSGRLDGGGRIVTEDAEAAEASDAFWEEFGDDPRVPRFWNAESGQEQAGPGKPPVRPVGHTPDAPPLPPVEGSGQEGGEVDSPPPPPSPPSS
jgi:hypothetical protein